MKRKFWFEKQEDELQNTFSSKSLKIKWILKIFNIKVKKSYRFISIPIWLYSAYKGVKNKQFFFWKLPKKNTHIQNNPTLLDINIFIDKPLSTTLHMYIFIHTYECNWLNMNLYVHMYVSVLLWVRISLSNKKCKDFAA